MFEIAGNKSSVTRLPKSTVIIYQVWLQRSKRNTLMSTKGHRQTLTPQQTLFLVIMIPVAFEILFAAALLGLIHVGEEKSEQLAHIKMAEEIMRDLECELIETGKVIVPSYRTNGEYCQQKLISAISAVEHSQIKLNSIADSEPDIRKILGEARPLILQLTKMFRQCLSVFQSPNIPVRERSQTLRSITQSLMFEMKAIGDAMSSFSADFEAVEPKLRSIKSVVQTIVLSGLLLSILTSIAAACLFALSIVRKLKVVERNATTLAVSSTETEEPTGYDVFAELNSAIFHSRNILRELHEREMVFLRATADVICAMDANLKIKELSSTVSRDWGFEQSELTGRALTSLISLEKGAFDLLRFQQDEDRITEFEGQLKTKAGRVLDTLWHVRWSEANKTYYCVARDVTEQRSTQRMKQRFLAAISHDLRSPLASLASAIGLICGDGTEQLSNQSRQDLLLAEVEIARVRDMINTILDLEQLVADKLQPQLRCVSAIDTCCAAIETVTKLVSEGPSFSAKFKDVAMLTDELMLTQVLVNIIIIIHSMVDSSALVEIKAREHNDTVIISIGFESHTAALENPGMLTRALDLRLKLAKQLLSALNGELSVERGTGSRRSLISLSLARYETQGEETST